MTERRSSPMLNQVLQHTLRGLCGDTQWVYAVFWRILPRNYPPPKWETDGGLMDRSKGNKRNWILVWEDGFCDFPACKAGTRYGNLPYNHADNSSETTMHPELFFKMSHEVYNYGEGLMGKVAADNSHKWVYREPMEHDISFLSPWHGSLDPHPRTWEAQFKAGIQTIAVISVREGLIQLGSTKKIVEDLNFVILMQRKFNYLQSIPGVLVPHPSSPLPNVKRRDGPPPADGAAWGTKDQALLMNGLFSKSCSDPYRIMTAQSKHFSNCILGMKRPPENEIQHNFSSKREFPFLSSGLNFNGTSLFDVRQSESPSPQKTLNTGQSPNSISLLPSMSSLHNLLSKLPSIPTLDSTASSLPHATSPSVLRFPSTTKPQKTVPPRQPISPTSSTDSPIMAVIPGPRVEDANASPRSSSSGLHQCGTAGVANLAGTSPHSSSGLHVGGNAVIAKLARQSPQVDQDGTIRDTSTSDPPEQSWQRSSDDNEQLTSLRGTLKDQGPVMASKELMGHSAKDKLTSFLDSFDLDSLTDYGLHDDLEGSETYNSFLSEII